MQYEKIPEDYSKHKLYNAYNNNLVNRITYFLTGVEPSLINSLPYEARSHRGIGLYMLSILVFICIGIILFRYSFGLPFASSFLAGLIVIAYAMTIRAYFSFINGPFYSGWVSFLLSIPLIGITWLLFNPFIMYFFKEDYNDGKNNYQKQQVAQIQKTFEKDSVNLALPLEADTPSEKSNFINTVRFNISTLEPYKLQLDDSIKYYSSILQQTYSTNDSAKKIYPLLKNLQSQLTTNLAAQDKLYISLDRINDSLSYYEKNIKGIENRGVYPDKNVNQDKNIQGKRDVLFRRSPKNRSVNLQEAGTYLQDRKKSINQSLKTLANEENKLRGAIAGLQAKLKKYSGGNQQAATISNKISSLNDESRQTATKLTILGDTLNDLAAFDLLAPGFDSLRQVRDSVIKKIQGKNNNLGIAFTAVKYQLENDPEFRRKYLSLSLFFLAPFIFLLLYANLRKNIYRDIYKDYIRVQEEKIREQAKSIIDIEKIKNKNIRLDNTLKELRSRNLSNIDLADISPSEKPEDFYFHTALKLEEVIKKIRYTEEDNISYIEEALKSIDNAISISPSRSAFWELKSRLHFLDENTSEGKKAADEFQRLRANELFQENLSKSIIIDEMVFEGLRFYGTFSWKLNPNMNILLGRNGYGKSHILSIICAVLQNEPGKSTELSGLNKKPGTITNRHIKIYLETDHEHDETLLKTKKDEIENLKTQVKEKSANENDRNGSPEINQLKGQIRELTESLHIERGMIILNPTSLVSKFGKIPLLAIPDLRFVNKATEFTDSSVSEKLKGDEFLKNTAYHFINQLPYESVLQNLLNILATSYYENDKTFNGYFFTLISSVFNELTGNTFKWDDVQSNNDGSYKITVITDGSEDPIPVQKISQGTFSVLSVFGLIYIFLKKKYPHLSKDEDILQQQSIVIIDELDAHLHPSWQQKLIGLVRKTFPNCQFIITAHSPLLVAGCKDEEVSVMREIRDENNMNQGFLIEQIKDDFIGYTSDELYKRIFEIEGKDELYLKYTAMQPFEKQMIKEKEGLEELKRLRGLSAKQEADLKKLYEDLYYLGKAKNKIEEKNTLALLKSENIRLKSDIESLKVKLTNSGTSISNL